MTCGLNSRMSAVSGAAATSSGCSAKQPSGSGDGGSPSGSPESTKPRNRCCTPRISRARAHLLAADARDVRPHLGPVHRRVEDVAAFTARERGDQHLDPLGHVSRHRRRALARLVVGVRVHRKQPQRRTVSGRAIRRAAKRSAGRSAGRLVRPRLARQADLPDDGIYHSRERPRRVWGRSVAHGATDNIMAAGRHSRVPPAAHLGSDRSRIGPGWTLTRTTQWPSLVSLRGLRLSTARRVPGGRHMSRAVQQYEECL